MEGGHRVQDALIELKALAWRFRAPLALGLALTIVNRLASFVLPAMSKVVVDRVIGRNELSLIAPIAGLCVLGIGAGAITTYFSYRVLGLAGQRAVTELRSELLLRVLALPVSYFDEAKIGAVVSRIMADTEHIENLIGTGMVTFASAILTAVIGCAALLYLNWRLTLVVLGVLIISAAWGTRAFAGLYGTFHAFTEANARTTARLTETLGGISVVKAYAAERHESGAFRTGLEHLYQSAKETITGVARLSAGTTLMNGATSLLLIVAGGYSVAHHVMTLGDLVAYVVMASLLATPLLQMSALGATFGKAIAALGRMHELRLERGEDHDEHLRMPLPRVTGEVRLERVSYAYRPGEPVIHDVELTAPAGATVALVGPSGSGKSTLCRLLLAFDQPSSGRILIDGHDLARVRLRDYRSSLGVVLQENFLFDGSVRDNIAFARPGASEADIKMASRIAHCDEFVTRLPNGFDTIVGERGVKLSGGQRQRIAIARAILADPRILILDEATSSLDSESETLIRDGLRALRVGRTTFVIAHRLSTIESADQILVLDGGRVVERGTHAELIALDRRYRRLHRAQVSYTTS
jgi:subfamily B ATP-binding cassette protein MsbA